MLPVSKFQNLKFSKFLLLALLLALVSPAAAQEVQRHGVVFEQWIRDTFFGGYRPADYTQKWDIPAEANLRHGGVPVNPKAIKYGAAIDLGDALRQFDIDEPFLLVVGFWRQDGDHKRFVKIAAPRVEPAVWRPLWGEVGRADLERLDALIKDRSLDVGEVRRRARALKTEPPFNTAVFTLNPKIDTKGQRRLQCSLRFRDFFARLAPEIDPAPETEPSLWGVPFPGSIPSGPRTFDDTPAATADLAPADL